MSDTAAGWRIWTLPLGDGVLLTPYTGVQWRSAVQGARCLCPGRLWPHTAQDPGCEAGIYVFLDSGAAVEEATKVKAFADPATPSHTQVILGYVQLHGVSAPEFKPGYGYSGAVEQRGRLAVVQRLYVVPEWCHESPAAIAHRLRGRYAVPVDVEPRDPAKTAHLKWVRTAVVHGGPVRGARFGLVQR